MICEDTRFASQSGRGRAVKSRRLGGLGVVVALLSWGGLGYLVLTQPPSALTKAMFFPLLFLAVTSTAVAGLARLRGRLGNEDEPGVVLRQGAWAGLFVILCAGLQMGRMLEPIVALVMAAILVLMEMFLLQHPERMYRLWYRRTARRRDSRSGDRARKR
jgi:hypothetical protein